MIPDTVKRINRILPGETFVYYRGDFESDISRCIGTDSKLKAPHYASVLMRVRDAAKAMAASGRAIIEDEPVTHTIAKLVREDLYEEALWLKDEGWGRTRLGWKNEDVWKKVKFDVRYTEYSITGR